MFIISQDIVYSGPKGNIINISKRHCRIGKVTPKPQKRWIADPGNAGVEMGRIIRRAQDRQA